MIGALRRVIRFSSDRPVVVAGVCAILIVLGVVGAARLDPDQSIAAIAPRHSPAATAMLEIERRFASGEDCLVLLEPFDADDARAAEHLHTAGETLIAAIEADPSGTLAVDTSGVETRAWIEGTGGRALSLLASDAAFERLLARFEPGAIREQIARTERELSRPGPPGTGLSRQTARDPLHLVELLTHDAPALVGGVGADRSPILLSPDARSALVRLRGKHPVSDSRYARQVRDVLDAAMNTARRAAPVHAEATGGYLIADFAARHIRADMIATVGGSLGLVMIVFTLAFRRGLTAPLVAAPTALAILLTLGAAGALGVGVTPMTAALGAILAGLAVDYTVHLLAHLDDEPHEPPRPLVDQLAPMIRPLSGACLTSALAFAVLSRSELRAAQQFGLLGSAGLVIALAMTMLCIPAALSVLGRRRPTPRAHSTAALITRPCAYAGRTLCVSCAVLLAMLGAALTIGHAPRLTTDSDAMHPQPNTPMQARERVGDAFGLSPDALLVLVRGGSSDDVIARAHRVHSALRGAPDIAGVVSPAPLLADPATTRTRLNALDVLDPDAIIAELNAALDDSLLNPAAFDGYGSFVRSILRPTPPTLAEFARACPSLAATSLPDDSGPPAMIVTALLDHPLNTQEDRDDVLSGVRTLLADVHGVELTGMSVIVDESRRAIVSSAESLGIAALIVVCVVVLVTLGRPLAAVLALIPIGVGALTLGSYLMLTGASLNLVNLIALPLVLGLGIDDGIMLVSAAHREPDAPIAGLAASSFGVLITSVTTAGAFGTLMLSSTPAIASLGELMVVGVLACWGGAIFVLAPLIVCLADRRQRGRA